MVSQSVIPPSPIDVIGNAVDVERIVHWMGDQPGEVHLDFSHLASTANIDPRWGAVLSNVITRVTRDRPLDVDLPEGAAAQTKLARAGLLFALARHPKLRSTHLSQLESDALSPWRRNWQPVQADQALFDDVDALVGEPSVIRHRLVSFLNPNEVPRDFVRSEKAPLVHTWLRNLVGRESFVDKRYLAQLLRDITVITDELLDNVRNHALVGPSGQCSLSLFATRGQTMRIYVTVMDTGRGIPNSLSEKYGDMIGTPMLGLQRALGGELDSYARDRGRGLSRIREIVERRRGRLFIASGPLESGEQSMSVDTDFAEVQPNRDAVLRHIPMLGTVVTASFKIESGHPSVQAAPRLELPDNG